MLFTNAIVARSVQKTKPGAWRKDGAMMPTKKNYSNRKVDRRDVWNARLLKWSKYDGDYEMPVLPPCSVIPEKLIALTNAKIVRADESFIHCYEDDYKFEKIWRTPQRYLSLFQAYGGAIAPDFSVYREMPLPQQLYNIYRSRVIGYWLSENGVTLIPNVRWGDKRTFDFAFDGLPCDSVVAVGTHGCVKHADDRRHFFEGFMVMLEQIQPRTILIYGSTSDRILPSLFVSNIDIVRFESDFAKTHKAKVA